MSLTGLKITLCRLKSLFLVKIYTSVASVMVLAVNVEVVGFHVVGVLVYW